MARFDTAIIEPVGADLVALAQAHALDATAFPHASLPAVRAGAAVVWVAREERGGPVVGFVGTASRNGALEITGLAVAEGQRRRGLGRALLRAALAAAREQELSAVSLHVSTGNPAALALYDSEGFGRAARLAGFYSARHFPDDGDAWLMMREVR
ncbi:MAG: ribosomal-protein-alanine N-acetyltransferase [Labilithrix sp.]|nr:ribosomal-protein-alanine N-acetyltransferase [Labilithrix sp.]